MAGVAGSDRSLRWMRLRWGIVVALVGVSVGTLAGMSWPLAIGVLVASGVIALFLRVPVRPELMVALYWVTFTTHQTLFADTSVGGLYFPFYGAFAAWAVLGLIRPGIRVFPPAVWLYAAFLFIVVAALLSTSDPIDSDTVKRLFIFAFGLLVLTQFASRRGLDLVSLAFVVGGVVVSVWTIASAIGSGFAYRAGVDVGQNAPAFFIGFGLVTAFTLASRALISDERPWIGVLAALLTGLMVYASLLLASRGMSIAVLLAIAAVLVRSAAEDRSRVLPLFAVAALVPLLLLLPGGDGFVERLQDETFQTGGSRFPIWLGLVSAYRDGGPLELVFGQGFGASADVVQRTVGTLSSAHNGFLMVLIEFGLLGLVLFVALHLALARWGWREGGFRGMQVWGLAIYLAATNLSGDTPE